MDSIPIKLKPLIKTHWLASQNPMTTSLGGLKRVVFSLPTNVLNAEFTGDEKHRVDLPARDQVRQLPADEEELRVVSSRRQTFSRELFWTLFSGTDSVLMREAPSSLLQLARSIEFHYENGECLSLIGIFRKEGLPLFLNPKFYLSDHNANWPRVLETPLYDFMLPLRLQGFLKKEEDFKRAWVVILETLTWAMERKKEVGDLDVLCSVTVDGNRYGYPLEEIQFTDARPVFATVVSEKRAKNTCRITLWQGVKDQAPVGVVRLFSVGRLGDLESQFNSEDGVSSGNIGGMGSAPEHAVLENLGRPLEWRPRLVNRESGGDDIQRALVKLEKTIGTESIFFLDHTLIEGDAFKPYLGIDEVDGSIQMKVSFGLEKLGLRHLNFPSSLQTAMAPFRGGMDHFFGLDRKELASKQVQFRNADLSFLRHQGLALFCLLEMTNWVLGRPMTSGEQFDFSGELESAEAHRQFDRFLTHLKNAIPGLFGKPGTAFEKIFSAEVRSLFLEFIEKLLRSLVDDRSMLFVGDQILEIRNTHQQVLPLLRFLILYFVEASGGKVLIRTQSPVGDTFKASLGEWLTPVITPDPLEDGVTPFGMEIGLYDKYVVSLLFDLSDHGTEVHLNGTPLKGNENPFRFSFSVGSDSRGDDANWFDLHPQIFFNGTRVSTAEVKLNFTPDEIGFIEYRGLMYRIDKKALPSMKSLQQFWRKISTKQGSTTRDDFGDKVYRLARSQSLELLMLKAQGIEVEAKGPWKKIFDYYENGLGVDKIQLPENMDKKLLTHQREGAQWLHDLYELRLGAILADEMGLGKTFQVLAFLQSLYNRKKLGKCLIVVPTSLVYNWMEEKKKFAPELPVEVFQAIDKARIKELLLNVKDGMIIITTYGLVNENLPFFKTQDWNVVAFDEAQSLKNISSLRSISARALKANFTVCLTGTPMENHYLEFYSLCDLVVPGCLGDPGAFRKTFYNQEVQADSLRELRLTTRPLLLRRTKKQVKLSLPAKTLQKVLLPFSALQKEIYKKMAMTFSRQVEDLIKVEGEKKVQIAMFAALMRLRQICSDPAAVPGVVFNERPVKVEHFLTALQDHLANEESVIVFTQFLTTLGRIRKELAAMKVPTYTLQGSVSSKERLRLISEFQESPEPGVMLMTLKTGGVGLNLTKASVVYHLEPWWNPAVENQATDRAHRMGQTKDVSVYNLLIEGSLEERITDLKLKKQGSFDRLFGVEERADEAGAGIEDSNFEGTNALSREDFIYLLNQV